MLLLLVACADPLLTDTVAAEQGNKLFHSVGCVACHSPKDPEGAELLRAHVQRAGVGQHGGASGGPHQGDRLAGPEALVRHVGGPRKTPRGRELHSGIDPIYDDYDIPTFFRTAD